MKYILLSLFFTGSKCLTTFTKASINKPSIYKYSQYEVGPINTILYYNLDELQQINIQNEINIESDNRFNINNPQIYVSLHDFKVDHDNVITKFEIFVCVYDKINNLNGQYILESKNYTKSDDKSIIRSFFESNSKYFCSLSYYPYNLDDVNFNIDISFDFIYHKQDDNDLYLRNIGNCINKISYIPIYQYTSEFKYKNMFWKKSNKIIYFKKSFYYK